VVEEKELVIRFWPGRLGLMVNLYIVTSELDCKKLIKTSLAELTW